MEQGIVQKTHEQRLKFKEVEEGRRRASRQRKQHEQSEEVLVPDSGTDTCLGALKKMQIPRPHTESIVTGEPQESAFHRLFWKPDVATLHLETHGCRGSGCPRSGGAELQ